MSDETRLTNTQDVLAKAKKLLEALMGPCEQVGGEPHPDCDHAWRDCRRCLAATEWDGPASVDLATVCVDALNEHRALRAELGSIDAVLARRPALDRPTRRENIEKAISVAATADALRAEVARLTDELATMTALWGEVGQRIESAAIGYNSPQIVAVFTENKSLRAEVARLTEALATVTLERDAAWQDHECEACLESEVVRLTAELAAMTLELDAQTPKTCQTCRYWTSHYNVDKRPQGNGSCGAGVMVGSAFTPKSFGCTLWDEKE